MMETPDDVFPRPLLKQVEAAGIVAVVVIEDASKAVPLARALVDGGIRVMELTLRTEAAFEALREIRNGVPEMMVGCGTVLDTGQVDQILALGATFGVSPGLNARVVRHAMECGLPFAPGVATPSDVEAALELGCHLMKFFPAELSGGLPYLQAIAAPFAHREVRFLPLGGLGPANASDYLEQRDLVAAIGGSWLAPKKLVEANDWVGIQGIAEDASQLVRQVPGRSSEGNS